MRTSAGDDVRGTVCEVPCQNIFVAERTVDTILAFRFHWFRGCSWSTPSLWAAWRSRSKECWSRISGVLRDRIPLIKLDIGFRDWCSMWRMSNEAVDVLDWSEIESVLRRIWELRGRCCFSSESVAFQVILILAFSRGTQRGLFRIRGAIHCSYAIHAETVTSPNDVTAVEARVRIKVYRFWRIV